MKGTSLSGAPRVSSILNLINFLLSISQLAVKKDALRKRSSRGGRRSTFEDILFSFFPSWLCSETRRGRRRSKLGSSSIARVVANCTYRPFDRSCDDKDFYPDGRRILHIADCRLQRLRVARVCSHTIVSAIAPTFFIRFYMSNVVVEFRNSSSRRDPWDAFFINRHSSLFLFSC